MKTLFGISVLPGVLPGYLPRVLLGAIASVACSACSAPPIPDLRTLYDEAASSLGEDRVPVIVLPGVLGSRLVSDSGLVVWGAFIRGAADADCPEGARAVALPMDPGTELHELQDDVRATMVLDEVEVDLGFLRRLKVRAYRGILATLAAGQYADQTILEAGDVDYGGSHFTCFQRAYDWRRDISESAGVLHGQVMEAQRRVREGRSLAPDAPVRVDVVAHSMGGLLLRYYLRYGAAPLPSDGSLPPLTWAGARHVRNAVMVGTPSFGSADALQQLVDGLDLHPFFPNYRPAVLGTMPAIYQLLPRARHGRIIEASTGLPVDVFDVATWDRFGWGLLDPDDARTRYWLLPGLTDEDRERVARDHLRRLLARAEQFHRALDVPAAPPAGTHMILFAGDAKATASTLTVDPSGRLRVSTEAPGDGSVTRGSALADERLGRAWTPGLESPVAWDRIQFLATDHLGLTKDPAFSDNLLWLLLEQ